ncbi:MAG: DUF4153 domain-containing protein [Verrucomicrobiota bacterium]
MTTGLRETSVRFPAPTLAAAATTACLVISINLGNDAVPILRLAILCGLGFVLSLLADLKLEARAITGVMHRGGVTVVVITLLIGYQFIVMPAELKNAPKSFFYSYGILLFCLHLGIALVPLLRSADKSMLWRFNLSLFLRFFFSSINAVILFAGLALAIVSIDKLFGLNMEPEIYAQLWSICAFFIHPMLFLGGIPKLDAIRADEEKAYPKPLHFTLQFIALPLVLVYLIILYAYVGKILILQSWPNGWVAMPIFILSVISLLTYVLSAPLAYARTWSRLYHQWLFRLLFPLSIVLFLALQIRLNDYGMTINRYLGLALAIWLFGLCLAKIIRPSLHVGWIPATLLIISLIAIYGGTISAFSWSQRSQLQRIQILATETGTWNEGRLVPSTSEDYSRESASELSSSLRYLFEHFGAAPLSGPLASFHAYKNLEDFASKSHYSQTNSVMDFLGLETNDYNMSQTQYRYSSQIHPTYSHQWMIHYNFYERSGYNREIQFDDTTLSLDYNQDTQQLRIAIEEETLISIDTQEWVDPILDSIDAHRTGAQDPLSWDYEAKGWQFTLMLKHAGVYRSKREIRNAGLNILFTQPEN